MLSDLNVDGHDAKHILSNPSMFLFDESKDPPYAKCKLCDGAKFVTLVNAAQHEADTAHVLQIRKHDGRIGISSDYDHIEHPLEPEALHSVSGSDPGFHAHPSSHHFPLRSSPLPPSSEPRYSDSSELHRTPDRLLSSSESIHAGDNSTEPFHLTVHGPAIPGHDDPDQLYDDFGGLLGSEKPMLDPELASDDEPVAGTDVLSDALHFDLNFGEHTDSEDDLHPDVDVDDVVGWWPWAAKKVACTDVLGGFPHAVFSETEIGVTQWYARTLGVQGLPSARTVKNARAPVQKLAGSQPKTYTSIHGNIETICSLAKILEHEWANPRVRPHIRCYPEDAGEAINGAQNGTRWLWEVNPQLAAPMARQEGIKPIQDYFIYEPALARVPDELTWQPVMPVRWFTRDGAIHAQILRLRVNEAGDGYVVCHDSCSTLPLSEFRLDYTRLKEDHNTFNLPPPVLTHFLSKSDGGDEILEVLDEKQAPLPNPLRAVAGGKRLYSAPMFLYCDDTSGNLSKKWNKHNSWLFTLAGLLHEHGLLPFNIHFLATSNVSSPLEMAHIIIAEMKRLQDEGVLVWDCEHEDMVVLLPWILALLGDNPMQSEMASHIGLTGKFFCRTCNVCGKSKSRPAGVDGEIQRIQDFLGDTSLRSYAETKAKLESHIAQAMEGIPTRVEAAWTADGLKDRYFLPMFEKIQKLCSVIKTRNSREGRLQMTGVQDAIRDLVNGKSVAELLNPLWRMDELNPCCDTPVEILHVILLGIVKYFWRDAVARVSPEDKATLRLRLSCIDVSDLGLSRLRGFTLVHYAGSLTGRDFRAILQVAPFVLEGLLPERIMDAWRALCNVAPLIFQPTIANASTYMAQLKAGIDDLLLCTAAWSTQWFNKPKFHLLLHIPFHVRRIAPSLSTATEGFESHNSVIRKRSVHSNRQAPGRDIAEAMSFMHAVRHLVSGGYVLRAVDEEEEEIRVQAGARVRSLIENDTFAHLMGILAVDRLAEPLQKRLSRHINPLKDADIIPWSSTQSGRALIAASASSLQPTTRLPHDDVYLLAVRTCAIPNHDVIHVHGFVLFKAVPPVQSNALATRSSQTEPELESECHTAPVQLGRVVEILRIPSGPVRTILLQKWSIGTRTAPYCMPAVNPTDEYVIATQMDITCRAHTAHNCFNNGCVVTRTHRKTQERKQTGDLDDEIVHAANPDDRVLNLAQLRSAECFSALRVFPEMKSTDDRNLHIAGIVRAQYVAPASKPAPAKPAIVVAPPAIAPALPPTAPETTNEQEKDMPTPAGEQQSNPQAAHTAAETTPRPKKRARKATAIGSVPPISATSNALENESGNPQARALKRRRTAVAPGVEDADEGGSTGRGRGGGGVRGRGGRGGQARGKNGRGRGRGRGRKTGTSEEQVEVG